MVSPPSPIVRAADGLMLPPEMIRSTKVTLPEPSTLKTDDGVSM